MAHAQLQQIESTPDRKRALRILAKSIFKELRQQGYDSKQIVSLATELIAEVTTDLAGD